MLYKIGCEGRLFGVCYSSPSCPDGRALITQAPSGPSFRRGAPLSVGGAQWA